MDKHKQVVCDLVPGSPVDRWAPGLHQELPGHPGSTVHHRTAVTVQPLHPDDKITCISETPTTLSW